jgi:hypothetical protein
MLLAAAILMSNLCLTNKMIETMELSPELMDHLASLSKKILLKKLFLQKLINRICIPKIKGR